MRAAGPESAIAVPQAMDKQWYVVHTYSGYENKVRANLEKRVESMNMAEKIFRIVVPMEEEVEYKDGKKKINKRKIYPGYVMVEMIMGDDSWYVVRNTPGVTGFVGSGSKPIPLQEEEIENILKHMGMEAARPKMQFQPGQSIRVNSGPFAGFIGMVEEVMFDRNKLRVLVSMFGRETPVELEYSQADEL